MRTLDSNIFSEDSVPEDVDCMFTQSFDWGKTEDCQRRRQEVQTKLVELATQYDSNFKSIDQVIKDWGGYMSNEDFEYLVEHQESAHPLHAPQDYSIKVSERVLHLERAHYFLGSRDSDWHLPLLVTLREEGLKNYRQRSITGWQKKTEKQEKFAEAVQEKKKGEKGNKGKGKGKDQPTKGQGKQEAAPWNKGPRRSIYEETPADDWWSSWDSSWSQDAWAGYSQSSSSWRRGESWQPKGGRK